MPREASRSNDETERLFSKWQQADSKRRELDEHSSIGSSVDCSHFVHFWSLLPSKTTLLSTSQNRMSGRTAEFMNRCVEWNQPSVVGSSGIRRAFGFNASFGSFRLEYRFIFGYIMDASSVYRSMELGWNGMERNAAMDSKLGARRIGMERN